MQTDIGLKVLMAYTILNALILIYDLGFNVIRATGLL